MHCVITLRTFFFKVPYFVWAGKGAWPNNSVSLLERAFGEISRSLDRTNTKDQDFFYALGGFDILARIYKVK